MRFRVCTGVGGDGDRGGHRCDCTAVVLEWLKLPRCKSHVRADPRQVDVLSKTASLGL